MHKEPKLKKEWRIPGNPNQWLPGLLCWDVYWQTESETATETQTIICTCICTPVLTKFTGLTDSKVNYRKVWSMKIIFKPRLLWYNLWHLKMTDESYDGVHPHWLEGAVFAGYEQPNSAHGATSYIKLGLQM